MTVTYRVTTWGPQGWALEDHADSGSSKFTTEGTGNPLICRGHWPRLPRGWLKPQIVLNAVHILCLSSTHTYEQV